MQPSTGFCTFLGAGKASMQLKNELFTFNTGCKGCGIMLQTLEISFAFNTPAESSEIMQNVAAAIALSGFVFC